MRRIALFVTAASIFACQDKDVTGDSGRVIGEVEGADLDGDGSLSGEDCDDEDPARYPDADEVCDGVDNDCDDGVDEGALSTWYPDADADGYGVSAYGEDSCEAPSGWVSVADDCDDDDAGVYPGADETCDQVDQDCDAAVDEDASDASAWYLDGDGDGHGNAEALALACEAPKHHVVDPDDCDDGDAGVYPGADETCDQVDQDCDDAIDEDALDAVTWYGDLDGDGFGPEASAQTDCDPPADSVLLGGDCDDDDASAWPGATELCDGVQNDCEDATWIGDAGVASFQADADGSWTDLTAALTGSSGAPAVYSATTDGDLWFCEGTWYVNLDLDAVTVLITGRDGAASTTLSGGEAGAVIYATGSTLDIEGLTIADGAAEDGAGVYLYDTTAGLTDVTLRDNVAETAGGALFLRTSGAVIDDCTIEDNEAHSGGGVYASDGSVVFLSGSTVQDNDAWDGGGLMVYDNSEALIDDSAISDNTADDDAGGIFVATDSTISLDASTVDGNAAATGGGLLIFDGSHGDLSEVILQENDADNGGGLFVGSDATATASGGELIGNTATYAGAGFYLGIASTMELSAASLSDNAAGVNGGGGFVYYASVLTDSGSSFTDNTSGSAGGALSVIDDSGLDLTSTAFTGNTAEYGGALYLQESELLGADLTLDGNGADHGGAGFFGFTSDATLTGGSVSSNLSLVVGGGLVVYDGTALTMDGVAFDSNTAVSLGGGLYLDDSTVSATSCDFTSNSPSDGYNYGATYTWGAAASFTCDGTGCD